MCACVWERVGVWNHVKNERLRTPTSSVETSLTHLGLVTYICVVKNSPHFPSDAYMRRKSLYFSYRSRGETYKTVSGQDELIKNVLHCQYFIHISWLSFMISHICHDIVCLTMDDIMYHVPMYLFSLHGFTRHGNALGIQFILFLKQPSFRWKHSKIYIIHWRN